MPPLSSLPSQRRSWAWAHAALIALVACGCSLLLASAASAADFTWSGGGGASANAWSNRANWSGGTAPAPSSSIGNLTFPLLSGQSVAANDLSGLSINHLSIDDTNGYALNGQGFTLGSGGLAVTENATGGHELAEIYNPITLGGNQAWDISGRAKAGQTTEEGGAQNLEVTGQLSGASSNLTIDLHNPNVGLVLGNTTPMPDDELGDVTVEGVGSTSFDQILLDANLNATDGHSLTVKNASLFTERATGPLVGINSELSLDGSSIGPLTSIGSRLQMGKVLLPSASFDAGSAIKFGIGGPGTQAGTDYTQLNSTGSVSLDSSTLELNGLGATVQFGTCAPPIGQVDTLISTTGSLTGTFGNAPEGTTLTATECLNQGPHGEVVSEAKPSFRINYNTASSPETVTATVTEEAASTGGSKSGGGGTGGGSVTSSGESSSTGSGGGSTPTASISAAQIAALLSQQLAPTGKAAKIGALLKGGGFLLPFKALEAGTVSVGWYQVPSGAKLAKKGKAKPVLIASGKLTFPAAGTGKLTVKLTAAGKRLLKHAKRLKLTAKGTFTPSGKAPLSVTKGFVLRQ
jgi:hypothetical protein